MSEKCKYRKNHLCEIWIDYQISQAALEEADELCHGNWIEIQHLWDKVAELEQLLQAHGIDVPK